MIELSQIPNTSKLKELRGQINTMANEINGNQMVIGQVLRPTASINFKDSNTPPVTVTEWFMDSVFAVCMPNEYGVYVANVFGGLATKITADINANDIDRVSIKIPAVKLPNRTEEVSMFVNSSDLGFDMPSTVNTGLQVTIFAKGSTSSISVTTGPLPIHSSTNILLNRQDMIGMYDELELDLWHEDFNTWH